MGCINSKPPIKYLEEELKILSFESSLSFIKLNIIDIDRTFHRYSTNCTMTNTQFSRAIQHLDLPIKNFSDFYNKFSHKSSFQTKRLICLGLLLSKSSDLQKLKVLFQCYDTDLSDSLSAKEIREFLEDLTLVSCDFIPYYALSLNSNDSELLTYINHVTEMRKSIVSQICNYLTEDKKIISLADLTKAFIEDEATSYIFSPQKMRTYCVKIRSLIKDTANYALKVLDNQEIFEFLGFNEEKEFNRKVSKRMSGNGVSS